MGDGTGWLSTEVGFIFADEIAAVIVEERSYEQERPSKGYSETHYFDALLLVTKGGAKILVETGDRERLRDRAVEIMNEIEQKTAISIDWGVG